MGKKVIQKMYGKTFQQQGEMTAVVCLCRDYHFIAENREERTIFSRKGGFYRSEQLLIYVEYQFFQF